MSKIHPNFSIGGHTYKTGEDWFTLIERSIHDQQHFSQLKALILEWEGLSSEIEFITSGSTGRSKRIKHSKENIVNSAKRTAIEFQVPNAANILLCLALEYVAGKMMLYRAMINGWNLCIRNPAAKKLIYPEEKFHFSAMVPKQVRSNIDTIDSIGCLIIGGTVLSQDLESKLCSKPNIVFETYGMTESLTHIARRNITKGESSFQAFDTVKIAKDERGCLKIMDELLNLELATNDFVEIVNSNMFELKGRIDNVINSGGIKISPELMERKLHKVIHYPLVLIGIPDQELGERLILVLEAVDLNSEILKDLEIKISSLNLPMYHKPKMIVSVPKFKRTKSSKPLRSLIKKDVIDLVQIN